MKTPDEIAAQIVDTNYADADAPEGYTASDNLDSLAVEGELSSDIVRALIIAGIEADRAQRYAEAPEQDTLERALWRIDTVLAGFYDGESEEPVQALGDLMTDILHWCDYHDRSLRHAEDRATQMVDWERADWGLPSIHASDRMFRKSGPIIRQRRSER